MTDHLVRIESHDEETTERLGEIIAEVAGTPTVVTLEGELGAGKTRLARGLARGLGIDPDEVSSPTFVVHIEHLAPRDRAFSHLDAYRVQGDDELEAIGFDELLDDPDRLIAIEWASRLEQALPSDRIEIRIDHVGESIRRLSILDRRRDDLARRRLVEALEARTDAFVTTLGVERRCPTCGIVVETESHRPFCSPRCRLADLERWFQGDYSISRPIEENDLDADH